MNDFRFPHRIAGVQSRLLDTNEATDTTPNKTVDALLVSNIENARYLSGFTGSNAVVIITPTDALFLTDGRYKVQSATEVPGFEREVFAPGTKMETVVAEALKRLGVKTIGIESGNMVVAAYEKLKTTTEGNITFISRDDIVDGLRQIKDAEEIAAIRVAVTAVDDCYDFLTQILKPGMREKDVAWEIEVFLRQTKGAAKLGFDTIVGSGPNSALIHGRAGERVIGSSGEVEFVLCDYGCELNGYTADITRTFFVGGDPTPRQLEMYNAVLQANKAAIAAIRPGVLGKDIDKIARDLLTGAGLGEAFGHGLGHGLGRVVHDHQAFSPSSELVLAAGMVVTVEPGAYIEGFGGVRIEDDVLIIPTGCEVLTRSAK